MAKSYIYRVVIRESHDQEYFMQGEDPDAAMSYALREGEMSEHCLGLGSNYFVKTIGRARDPDYLGYTLECMQFPWDDIVIKKFDKDGKPFLV